MKEQPKGKMAEVWKDNYALFVKKLRSHYPKSQIILSTTILNHSRQWDDAIAQVKEQLKDERVWHFTYKRNGQGTSGHLRILEAQDMADELSAFILSLAITFRKMANNMGRQ